MKLLDALIAAHVATVPGWDNEGPAGLETWVRDGNDKEVVVFETGDDRQDVANTTFTVMAHQALPALSSQMRAMAAANQKWLEFFGDLQNQELLFDAKAKGDAVFAELKALVAESAAALAATGARRPNLEFKVNIPAAPIEVRELLFTNFGTKMEAVAAAENVLKGTLHERAIIFRVELDDDGHVVKHEVCQYVVNEALSKAALV